MAEKVILLKIYFTNEKFVPPGIHFGRDEDLIMSGHITEAHRLKEEGVIKKTVGQKRPGIVDTGKDTQFHGISGQKVVNDLMEAGWQPGDVHGYIKEPDPTKSYGVKKWVVVVPFTKDSSMTTLESGTLKKIPKGLLVEWSNCHIWVNPPDGNGKQVTTINLTGRNPEAKQEGKSIPEKFYAN